MSSWVQSLAKVVRAGMRRMGLAMLHRHEARVWSDEQPSHLQTKYSPDPAKTMATKADIEMADALDRVQDPQDYTDLLQTNHCDAFAFSESEKLALELYDQLQELELQNSLLQAQQSGTSCSLTCFV